ncbi:g7602 [Coccomyxa viridis]|uniref:G7602 protein n=1 Tax=Coccomyxa viridis TaxID=1274662 RepID=A0ABP1FZD9_9CHLO
MAAAGRSATESRKVQTKLNFQKVEAPPPEPKQPASQPYSTARHILDRQLTPHGSAFGRAAAAAEAARAYNWIDCFRQPGARPGALTPEFPGRTTRACFSGSGDLLALLRDGLGVRIVDYRALQSRPSDGDNIYGDAHWAYPNSVLTTRCMAWNPQKELELYLLVHRGILRCSAERLHPSEDFEDRLEAFCQAAPEHIAFFRSNPELFAACSCKGEVTIWDPRADSSRRQTTLVAPQNMPQLTQVQVSSDGNVITAGTKNGYIILWDVRKGGSGVHQLGAYGPAKQPVLAVIGIRNALAAIPGLSAETRIPASNVHQLLLDPLDDTRAGYTLTCGWQGCIDLLRQEITHAYCPPARLHGGGVLRPAMWQPGSPFVSLQFDHNQTDTRSSCPSLEFLDFSSGSASPCMVRGEYAQRPVLSSATCLKLEEVGTSVTAAMHPTTYEIALPSYIYNELHIVSQLHDSSETSLTVVP